MAETTETFDCICCHRRVVFARRCCNGDILDSGGRYYIRVGDADTQYFTHSFKFVGSPGLGCFYFDIGDLDLLDNVTGFDTDLTDTPWDDASLEHYDDCDVPECGCKCCVDGRVDPDNPRAGERSGETSTSGFVGTPGAYTGSPVWYQFAGVTICPRVYTCRSAGTYLGNPQWAQVQTITVPTGPYTGEWKGTTETDYGCPSPNIPNISTTTKFYSDSGCATPNGNADSVDRMLIYPGLIAVTGAAVGSVPSPSCGAANANAIFTGIDPSTGADQFMDCFNPVTWNNALAGCECADNTAIIGFGQGYNGTCYVGTCCPDDGGI